jgi:hypothetical protein
MTVRAICKNLAGELHQHLKPAGFSKRGATFSRKRDGYVELFHIEGSRWNSGEWPWVFYVEIAARLDGVPIDESAKGLWREAHAVGHASDLVTSAPSEFSVTEHSVNSIAEQVARLICQASTALPDFLAGIRPRAEKGLISPLPLPASWAE